jgi:hypothetical protein
VTVLISRSATVTVGGNAVQLESGTVTLDERTTYAQADLTLALDGTSDGIDPRDSALRANITAQSRDGAPRTFNLGVRSRSIDHAGRKVTLRCASDEELVADWAPLAEDSTALDHQGSLEDIVNHVLGEALPGASLAYADDVPFPVSWDSANLIDNPGAQSGTTGMNVNDVSVTASTTTWAASGGASFLMYDPTSSNSYGYYSLETLGASNDRTYTASGTIYLQAPVGGSVSAQARRIVVAITTSTGPVFVQSAQAPNATGATRLAVKFRLPANALTAALFYFHGHSTGFIWWDDLRLSEGDGIRDRDIGRLDGNMADDDLYAYEWDDAANASTSRRTAFNPVPPETLVWPVGVSGWDFLLPITNAANRRLFCDEDRVWRLVSEEYGLPSVVIAPVARTSQGDDEISRDGDLWADGVVVEYEWDDAFGATQKAYDVAGAPGKVRRVRFERPYPGPGAAAGILSRMTGQGRQQTATILTDYSATPGMETSISLPGTDDQRGRLVAVEFDLHSAFMDITARGLTAVPSGSIDWLSGTIDALTGTIDGL